MNSSKTFLIPNYLVFIGIVVGLMAITDEAMAATAGGGLPFESWLIKIQNSITGPFAYTVSIIGLVAAGAMLIFGGDMNRFAQTLVFVVLVLSFIIAAQNTISSITGKGAEVALMNSLTKSSGKSS